MVNTEGKNASEFSQEFLDFMEYIGRTTDETAGNSGSDAKEDGISEGRHIKSVCFVSCQKRYHYLKKRCRYTYKRFQMVNV